VADSANAEAAPIRVRVTNFFIGLKSSALVVPRHGAKSGFRLGLGLKTPGD